MTDEKRSRTWLWVLVGGGAFFLFVLAVFTLVYLTPVASKLRLAVSAARSVWWNWKVSFSTR